MGWFGVGRGNVGMGNGNVWTGGKRSCWDTLVSTRVETSPKRGLMGVLGPEIIKV